MSLTMQRRDFLKAVPAGAFVLAQAAKGEPLISAAWDSPGAVVLEPFDYMGVKLLGSRWSDQYHAAREAYYHVSNNDILKGYRSAANLDAPGDALGGWCARNSNTVLGQWLSGMARMYRAAGDTEMRDKAIQLITEFAKTVKPNGDCGMRHYPYDKLVCGLVDMKKYAGYDDAIPLLERVTDFAMKNLDRENQPAVPKQIYQGRPHEWYTLAENLYRAYQVTGNSMFREFAAVWHYPAFWSKFADTSSPADAYGVHAYSHVNTFSSAAMAYAVTGDPAYLRIIKNAYDYMQNTQCYATGGYGPREEFAVPDVTLLRSLGLRYDCFEAVCGSWAGFKLSRYLTSFTGAARYGDWMERLFYNGVGASLRFQTTGKNFYYADYRLAGGMKAYNWEPFTCCSGSYIQNVSDYHNLIYYKDPDGKGLYVNLFVPSEVVWKRADGDVKMTQTTSYPAEETSTLTLSMSGTKEFSLSFRVPEWARGASVKINSVAANVTCAPGTWATMKRAWNSGDTVELRIPLPLRMQPIDRVHTDVVAIVRGPAVMALEADYHEPNFRLPSNDDDLNQWIVPDTAPGTFLVKLPGGDKERVRSKVRPYYDMVESFCYKMYFDCTKLPEPL
ncbi:MAG TPA: beta-L-arabinofuranosidase domain-containing protein [Bacteroidota bacterium]